MATINPWTRFRQLLPQQPRYVVTIVSVGTDGTSVATRRDGSTVRLKGTSVSAGYRAWVEGDTIVGQAPALTTLTQYV